MNKIIIRSCFAVLLLLFSAKIYAQADSVAERTGDLTQTASGGDTIISRNDILTKDSLQSYKNDKDFAYMKYLDSLLRKRKDLTVDTFSVNYSASQGSRRQPERERKQMNVPQVNLLSQSWVRIVLWILAALLIGFIVWKLFIGERFFRRNTTLDPGKVTKDEDDLSEPSGYDSLIAGAVASRNYRLAIRYSYLQTLKKLAIAGLLQYAADKTNYQYVNELRGKPYQNDFASLTLNYEYVWYGKFDIAETVYTRLAADYKSFYHKLSRI